MFGERNLRRLIASLGRRVFSSFVKPREVKLVRLEDVASKEHCRSQEIPPIVFQTFASRFLSEEHYQSVSEFRDINADLSFHVFDDVARDTYMEKTWGKHPIYPIFRSSLFPQMRADIFRYCLIYDRGGYYVDINKAIMAKITDLHSPSALGIISFEPNSIVVFPAVSAAMSLHHPDKVVIQWAFGFAPGHPVLARAIDKIVENAVWVNGRSFGLVRTAIVSFTGPGVFSSAVFDAVNSVEFERVEQLGVDFNGFGVMRVPGSESTPLPRQHYSRIKNAPILMSG